MASTLLKNGTIVDGTGKPRFEGSVLIKDNKIKQVLRKGKPLPRAATSIDASGYVIAPGFIDMHSHSDWALPDQNHTLLSPLLEQGVTTIVGGNCGVSPAPFRSQSRKKLERVASITIDKPFEYSWQSMDEFFTGIEGQRPIVNFAQLVGHASVRYACADTARGDMSEAELTSCLEKTEEALDEGACGVSFGLGYDPGMYSSLDELKAFARLCAKRDQPLTVHLKALSKISPCYSPLYLKPHNVRALREMIDLAKDTGCKLQVSHFIFVGRSSWPTSQQCFDMVEEARDDIDIMIDAFPYTCGNTTINAPLPYWFLAKFPRGFHNKLDIARLKLEVELGFRLVGFTYKDFQVMDIAVERWQDLNGLRITDIAEKWGISPFAAMLRVSEQSNGGCCMLFHAYSGEPGNEEVMERVLAHDLCLFETDAVIKSDGYPNPAAYGTFPKILGTYVRDKQLLSLEAAVSQMTGKSAARFGVKDRGVIAKGKAADVVMFDADKINDQVPAKAGDSARPLGIKHVFVNGEHAVKNGKYLKRSRAGRALRV